MCRLLAYCSRSRTPLVHLVGAGGLRDFTALSAVHSDGWGVALWQDGHLQVEKSAQRADKDERYRQLIEASAADAGMVHLRWATPGLAVGTDNSHPFRRGDVTMAHNGAIHPQDRLGDLLPPAWERELTGSTDSERYFLKVMSRLGPDDDLVAAIGGTVADISRRFRPNSLNAVFLTPGALYAVCWYDPSNIPAAAILRRGYTGPPENLAGYFDLAYRATRDAVVVASSGWPQDGWTSMPNGSVLVVDRSTLRPRVERLLPGPRPPAATVDRGRS